MRAAALSCAILLLAGPPRPSTALADSVPRDPEGGCARWDRTGWPSRIRVHLIHRRGSRVPARVVTVRFDDYVGTVLASGAAGPRLPGATLRAMAVVVATRAAWMVSHPQPGYRWRGRCYDTHSGSPREGLPGADAGQLYRHGTRVHSNIRDAVADVRGTLLRRPDGRLRKPAWDGTGGLCGSRRTGNRLPTDAAADCGRRGWGWRRILALYFRGSVA